MNDKIDIVSTPWTSDILEIFKSLSSEEKGLSSAIALNRLNIYGPNKFRNKESKSAFSIFLRQLLSPLIFILIGAGCITLFLGEYFESIVIFCAVVG